MLSTVVKYFEPDRSKELFVRQLMQFNIVQFSKC